LVCAAITLGGIELTHMIRKGQMNNAHASLASMAEQFHSLAA
jgi:hypothetical protein